MRALIFSLALITKVQICTFSAHAQMASIYTPGAVVYAGPYQPHPFSGRMYYYNPSAPAFPVGYGYGRGYGRYLQEETYWETRRIRQGLEYGNWRRGR